VVAHAFNPSTREAEAGGFLSLRPAWSTKWVPGQPGLYRETLSQKQTNKQTNKQKTKTKGKKEKRKGKEEEGSLSEKRPCKESSKKRIGKPPHDSPEPSTSLKPLGTPQHRAHQIRTPLYTGKQVILFVPPSKGEETQYWRLPLSNWRAMQSHGIIQFLFVCRVTCLWVEQRHGGVQSAAPFVLLCLNALTQQTWGHLVSPANSKCTQDNLRLAGLWDTKANPGSSLLETVLLRNSF